jgi:CBS domain-containing protein
MGTLAFEDAAAAHPDAGADEAMSFGPTTIRASEPVEHLVEALREEPDAAVLVTDPEGRLLGLLDLAAAERALAHAAEVSRRSIA